MDFGILGLLEVREGGLEIEIGPGRQRALLAVLLLHANELVSTDRLTDELWGAEPPATAAKIVQNHVSHLRRVLGADRLSTRAHGYVLGVRPGELDADEFESLVHDGSSALARGDAQAASVTLRQALRLWRGAPLEEFAFEPFAHDAIVRLEELHRTATEERIDADLALGQHAEVVAELEGLVRQDPLRERPHGQLMLALYRCGRQAEALRAYQDARRILVDELGLEPSEELQALQRAILGHDPAVSAPARKTAPIHPAATAPVQERRTGHGRRVRVFAVLGAALTAAAAVSSVVIFDNGPRARSAVVASNSVAVVDPHSGSVVARIRVGSLPIAIAAGHDSVWVANSEDGTVSRIDPRTRRIVATIGTGSPATDIAVGAGAVWVANGGAGTLSRIDPRSNTLVATLDLSGPDRLVPQGVYSVVTGSRFVWVASGSGAVVKIDPATGRMTRILVGFIPADLALSDGSLWVVRIGGRVLRIDTRTGRQTGIAIAAPNGMSIAAGAGGIWVTDMRLNGQGLLWWIDPETVAPQGITPLPRPPKGLATGAGAVWIADGLAGTLIEVDAGSGQISRAIRLGNAPLDVAYADGLLWVTVGSRAAATG